MTSNTSTKKVTFFPNVRVSIVEPLVTSENNDDAWYNMEEFKSFKKEVKQIQKALQKGKSLKNACLRGVEHMVIPEFKRQRRQRRDNVFLAVMKQQMESRSPQRIAAASAKETKVSRYEAISKAVQDAEEACQCYQESFESSTDSSKVENIDMQRLSSKSKQTPSRLISQTPLQSRIQAPVRQSSVSRGLSSLCRI